MLRRGGAQPIEVGLEELVLSRKEHEAFVEVDDVAADIKKDGVRTGTVMRKT